MSKEYEIATPLHPHLIPLPSRERTVGDKPRPYGDDKWGWQRGGISYIMWEKAYIEI